MSAFLKLASEPLYVIVVTGTRAGQQPFRWAIVESKSEQVVEETTHEYPTTATAFTAAQPALKRWLTGSSA